MKLNWFRVRWQAVFSMAAASYVDILARAIDKLPNHRLRELSPANLINVFVVTRNSWDFLQ